MMRSLGVVRIGPGNPAVRLNLKAPGAVVETKAAMGMCSHMLGVVFGPQPHPTYDEGFFRSDIWDGEATQFAEEWLARYKQAFPTAPVEGLFKSPNLYPSSSGILLFLALLGYPAALQSQIDYSKLSQLTTFVDATGGDPARGIVEAPYFSEEETRGVSTGVIVVGLGVFALGVWAFVKE